jgi:Caspase domain
MKKALLIGINYTNVPGDTLRGCIDDVVNVQNVLTSQYGYDAQADIVMLRDDSQDPAQQPTRQNILKAMTDIVAASANCSDIWIHYSGHGALINNGSTGVIVPVDYETAGFITADDMMTIFQNIQCTAMIMFDSCNSGAVCDLQWSYEYLYGNNFMRTQMDFPAIANPNIFMISGCKITQQSADAFDTTTNQYEGVFTDAVLNTLQTNGYNVTLGTFIQGICTWLAQNGITSQKPMLSSTSSVPRWTLSPV